MEKLLWEFAPIYAFYLHLLIWQTPLYEATYNWGIQQANYHIMAINTRSARYTRFQSSFKILKKVGQEGIRIIRREKWRHFFYEEVVRCSRKRWVLVVSWRLWGILGLNTVKLTYICIYFILSLITVQLSVRAKRTDLRSVAKACPSSVLTTRPFSMSHLLATMTVGIPGRHIRTHIHRMM